MAIMVGVKRAVIPDDLKDKVAGLSDETKELALSYLVGMYCKEHPSWTSGGFHFAISMGAWENLNFKFKEVARKPCEHKESND